MADDTSTAFQPDRLEESPLPEQENFAIPDDSSSGAANDAEEGVWTREAQIAWLEAADSEANPEASTSGGLMPEIELVGDTAPTLSDEALRVKAGELREAIEDEDVKEIKRLIGSISPADRERLREIYDRQRNDDGEYWNLEKDLIRELNDGRNPGGAEPMKPGYVEVVGIMAREEGETNDAAQMQEAISRERGIDVLETLATLNPVLIARLERDYEDQFGGDYRQAIKEAAFMTPAESKFLEILGEGLEPDVRTTERTIELAKIAAEDQNVSLLAIALRGDIAREARELLRNDREFQALLREPRNDLNVYGQPEPAGEVPETHQFGGSQIVKDILDEGHVSLATIVDKNNHRGFSPFGIFGSDNKANVDLAIEHATDTERASYARGKQLGNREDLSEQELRDVNFYSRLREQLEDLGNDRETARWEAMLAGGQENGFLELTGALAGSYGDDDNFYRNIDDLSETDWMLLTDEEHGPELRQGLVDSLKQYADPEHRRRVLEILDAKIAASSYEESIDVRRSMIDVLSDTHSDDDLVRAVFFMGEEDRSRYSEDVEYQEALLEQMEKHTDGKDEALIKSMLGQIEEDGEAPELTAVDQVLWDNVFKEPAGVILAHAEVALSDTEFRERIKNGDDLTFEEREFKEIVEEAVQKGFFAESGFNTYYFYRTQVFDQLYENGSLSLDMKVACGYPRSSIYEQIPGASKEELSLVMDRLDDDEREIAEQVLKTGEYSTEDRLRSYIVDDGTSWLDHSEILAGLSASDLQNMKSRYAEKYGRDFDNDFLTRVKDDDKMMVQAMSHLINPIEDLENRQDHYDNLEASARSLGVDTGDGTKLTLIRSSQLYGEALQDFQQKYEQLPREKREELDRLFQQALEDYKVSKEAYASRIANIVTLVGGVSLAVATGGVSAAALPLFFAAGAAIRVGVAKQIQGEDFDMSLGNILKETAIGGTTGVLAVLGPETIAGLAGVGRVAAGNVLTQLSAKGINVADNASPLLSSKLGQAITRGFLRGEQVSQRRIANLAQDILPAGAPRSAVDEVTMVISNAVNRSAREAAEGWTNPAKILADARQVAATGAWAQSKVQVRDRAIDAPGTDPIGIEDVAVAGQHIANMGLQINNLLEFYEFGF